LKSHIVRMIAKEPKSPDGKLPEAVVKTYARSTEVAFVNQLLDKVERAAMDFKVRQVVVGGGVSANSYLRSEVKRRFADRPDFEVVIPPLWCTTDNAAMIARTAHHMLAMGLLAPLSVTTEPNRRLDKEGKDHAAKA